MKDFSPKATKYKLNNKTNIMKKTYLKPEMEIVEINVNQQILAGSDPGLGGNYNGGTILSPEFVEEFEG